VTSVNTGTAVSSSLTGLDVAPLFMDADLGSTSSLLYITGAVSGVGGMSEILIYSAATETLLPSVLFPSGTTPLTIAGGASPSRMYTNGFGNIVLMLSGWFPSTSILGTLPRTVLGGDIVVHPDGNRVYAGDNSNVDVISVSGGSVTATLSSGGNSLAVHPSGYWVYAGEPFSSVDVIQGYTNLVVKTIAVPSGHSVSKMAVEP